MGRSKYLPYDPGVLPTKPAPRPGETVTIEVSGFPPYKDRHRSIRNTAHPRYEAFVALRRAATTAMRGRAWYFGPIRMNLTIFAPALHAGRNRADYDGGVMDTLDGSSGGTFTYLPIVFEDDGQVCSGSFEWVKSDNPSYRIVITFLE